MSRVSLGLVSFPQGEQARKSTVAILLIWMVFLSPMRNERSTLASIFVNPRRYEGLLVVFDSEYSGVSILVADDHLLFRELQKSHSRTRESYLLLLKDLELFEGLFSTNCHCISRIKPPSIRQIFEVTASTN